MLELLEQNALDLFDRRERRIRAGTAPHRRNAPALLDRLRVVARAAQIHVAARYDGRSTTPLAFEIGQSFVFLNCFGHAATAAHMY